MFIGILLFVLAGIIGLLFWIFIGLGIYKLVTKKGAKKSFITAIVMACVWVVLSLCSVGFVGAKLFKSAKDTGFTMPVISYENAKQNWSNKVLKKTSNFELAVDKVAIIYDEKEWLTTTDEKKANLDEGDASVINKAEKMLSIGDYVPYELTIVVDNHSKNTGISYKELRKSNLCYVKDENGVFIPAYIINHAEFDDVPWLLTWLLPQYKKDQKVQFVPVGKSYLNVRTQVPNGHTLSKFVFGNAEIDIDMSKVEINKVESKGEAND